MPYSAEISRRNPSCIVLLIDQSGSMSDPFGNGETAQSKAEGVATVTNKFLQNLVVKCARDEGVRDFFHIAVIGYGARVGNALGGQLAGRDLMPLSEAANAPLRVEERTKKVDDGAGGLLDQTIRFPVWMEPIADNGTPMCQALTRARSLLEGWLRDHADSFPPIVVNVTDGEATDGDPSIPATALRALATSDGNALLFNVHLSSNRAAKIEFPDSEIGLPDEFARRLFTMSSVLPETTRTFAQQEGYPTSENTRGFTFNADIVALIQFLDIGTRPSNLR